MLDLARMRRDRHRRLLDEMTRAGVETLVLLGQSNVSYATGAAVMTADGARAQHHRNVAIVRAGDEWPHLHTPWPEGVPPELPADHVHPQLPVELEGGARALVDALDGPVAIDELTPPLFALLRSTAADATAIVTGAKVLKTPDEVECIRTAQHINEQAMLDVYELVRPGVRTAELTARFLRRVYELGATANILDPVWQVMPSSIAAGPHSVLGDVVFPAPPIDRVLEAGDVVWVDTGIAYRGYLSDFGRTWIVGREPDARQRDQFARWKAVTDAVLLACRPGVTGGELVRIARKVAGGERVPWLRQFYLIHGVGTDSAEMPFIGTDLGDEFDESLVLAPGMLLVVEPAIWDDGDAGYRSEEVAVVTDDGVRLLSDHHYEPFA